MRLKGIEVLLVEDDVDSLELLASCLEAAGARVQCAASMREALALPETDNIDVLVTDLELPDGDGWKLLEQLQQRSGGKPIPAVAISGYSHEAWRLRVAASAFGHYVLKPIKLPVLIDWIALAASRDQGQP